MPISPRDYKEGLELQDAELLARLEAKPYRAYAIADLMTTSDNVLVAIAELWVLQTQLQRLVQKGFVNSKNMRGTTYYILE